jgi:CBS domain-containing protein
MFQMEDILHHPEEDTVEGVVAELLKHLALSYGIGNVRDANAAVLENLGKSQKNCIRHGILLPYARLEKVDEPRIAVATSPAGFLLDKTRFQVVVLVLIPVGMPGAFKQIENGLENAFPSEASVGAVAALESPLAVWKHFDEGGHRLPDHLQAMHVMDSVKTYIHVNDSLATAIDRFLEFKTAELPVLNAEHELVGVVRLKRLIRVCMPDYLLWVGDMEEYLNFEPFADMAKNEAFIGIRDIMTDNYAHVAENAPAVLVMKEIAQHETQNAYVLRGRKLVGIVKLLNFVKTILR